MNDKKKTASSNVNIDLGELDQLENELNELSGISSGGSKGNSYSASSSSETKTLSGFAINLFGFGNSSSQKPNTNNNEKTDSKIGSATAESIGNNKTWNLVYCCTSCNSTKNARICNQQLFNLILKRNKNLKKIKYDFNDEFKTYSEIDYLNLYNYAKKNGLRIW